MSTQVVTSLSSWTTVSEPITERVSSRLSLSRRTLLSKMSKPKRTPFTVHGLKSRLETEGEQSREMNPNLAEVVFPDNSLPFVIDKALVQCLAHIPSSHTCPVRKSSNHIWAKARAKQAVQSKRNLTQPPPDWKEESIANWLNQIGTALANIYTEDNGGPICAYYDTWGNQTVPQERRWSHAQKH